MNRVAKKEEKISYEQINETNEVNECASKREEQVDNKIMMIKMMIKELALFEQSIIV